MRRSNSSGAPVRSACTGASKPSAAAYLGTSCTSPSVKQDDAGEPVGRRVGQRLVEVGEEVRAGRRGIAGARGRHPLDGEVGDLAELGLELGLDRGGLRLAVAQRLAGAFVDDDDRHVGEALALLLAQGRVGERGDEGGEGGRAQDRAARAAHEQIADEQDARSRPAPQKRGAGSTGAKSIDQLNAQFLIGRGAPAAPARAPGRPCSFR